LNSHNRERFKQLDFHHEKAQIEGLVLKRENDYKVLEEDE